MGIGRWKFYVEPRDLWVGLYVGKDYLYFGALTLVARRKRACRMCGGVFGHQPSCSNHNIPVTSWLDDEPKPGAETEAKPRHRPEADETTDVPLPEVVTEPEPDKETEQTKGGDTG